MSRARILIADDHRMLAEGLRSLLEPTYDVVAIVDDGRELVQAALRLQPDVIVADISMPLLNGLDAIEQIRQSGCTAKIICMTMHDDALYAARALRLGASGFVVKHSASTELLAGIREALVGRTYVTPAIAKRLDRLAEATPDRDVPLTRRQREVLQLFAEGHTAKEVGKILHISVRTAEGHKAKIMDLVGARSTADLVQCAIRHGLIAPS
ncbi:MAG: response regulator [Pirellulaceae bacterium]